jgi:hypothetical protein
MSSSQRLSYPSKNSSSAAAPRHRGRCPLAVRDRAGQTLRYPPLPTCTSEPHLRGASTSGLCSAAESGHETERCRSVPHPVLPWALFPFEVLSPARRVSRFVVWDAARRDGPKRTAIRTTNSVLHPPRSVRSDPNALLAERTRGRHSARSRRTVRRHLDTRHRSPFRRTTPAGKHQPHPKVVGTSHRARRRPEGRTTIEKMPEAVRIPLTVHRGAAETTLLPILIEDRIRVAAPSTEAEGAEQCHESLSRVEVGGSGSRARSGCPARVRVGYTDLHGVFDVKERSEDRYPRSATG